MYKVDLHTHSMASPDGSLTPRHYQRMLEAGGLDYIAITDHNTVQFAQELQRQLGDRIIVGEEITAQEGEIIGLYLREKIPAGRTAAHTAALIKQQGGLVYIPHPFETVRKGLPVAVLEALVGQIDIIETRNGRAVFQNRTAQAHAWARAHGVPGAASSDAHGWHGWGKVYSEIDRAPTPATLAALLQAGRQAYRAPGLRALMYPKFNRLRRRAHA